MQRFSGRLGRAVAAVAASVLGVGGAAITGPVATATTGSACVSSPQTATHLGRFLGIVRPQAGPHAPAPRCPAASAHSGASGATNTESPYSGTPPLVYHAGQVMATPSVSNEVTLTPIFWGSSTAFASTYESVLQQFVADVAHDSGLATNVFSVLTQYTDSASNHVHYKVIAGTTINDTNSYPTSGCTPDSGPIYSDNSGYSSCLTDPQIQAEVKAQVSAHSLPTDDGHMYVMFLPKGVENCFNSQDGAADGQCTLNSNVANAGGFCAYHSAVGSAIYASMPFPVYQSPLGYTCSSEYGPGLENLNGNQDADVEVSTLSHEVSEAMTDPFGLSWFDSGGNEVGDDCAYIFGSVTGPAGAQYNQTINGHHYLLQEEFSNNDYVATSAGCIQHEELPTATIGAVPASPTTGQAVAFSATGSTDPDTSGGQITSYAWNFGDGHTASTTTGATTHTYSSTGRFTASLEVTDIEGWTSTAATTTVTVAAGPAVTSVTPSSIGAGTANLPVTITGSDLSSGATVTDSNPGVTFSSVAVQSSTTITADVSVTSGASPGATEVTVTEPGPTSAVCDSCLTVTAGPSVSNVTPNAVADGTSQSFQIAGAGFQTGAVVSVSGTGVTMSGVSSSPTSITGLVSVTTTATKGARDVTVTNPDGGTVSCSGCLAVDAAPAITRVAPGAFSEGSSVPGVQLTGSNFQSGVLVSVSGTGVTATVNSVSTGTVALTVTVTSGAAAGARNVTVTNPDGGTATCTGCLVVVLTQVTNGGFETGNLSGWTRSGTTGVTTSGPHSGKYAALLGSRKATNGDSSISQTFAIPLHDAVGSFYYDETCPDTVSKDWVTATLQNDTTGTTTTVLKKTCVVSSGWKQVKAWVVPTDVYTLTITNHDDNNTANPTSTKIDDVTLLGAPGLTNGGFESGSLKGWGHTGTAGVTTSGSHTGKYAALLGATTATKGVSSLTQTFTVPAGSSTLSFWYAETCKDTVSHDWATATLKDLITGTTVTVLAKTCTSSSKWLKVSSSVVAGHSYTLTLVNRDDDVSTTPTYTKYDDVVLS